MKKLFSKILAFTMVASMLSTAVFAEESIVFDDITLSNVMDESAENFINYKIPLYLCEDYARITLDRDVYQIAIAYFYLTTDYVFVSPLTLAAEDEYVLIYDGEVEVNDVIMPAFDFYTDILNEELVLDEEDTRTFLSGGIIDIVYPGYYAVITYDAEGNAISETTIYIADSDGIDSYETEETTEEEIIEIVTGTAKDATATVIVDGEQVDFEAYEIDGNNYFKLRDLAAVASGSEKQFEVTWDGELNAIGLISGQVYTQVGGELATGDGLNKEYTSTTATIYKDEVEVSFTAYEINGNNYFKLRDVCQAFDIGVTWDDATQTIGVDTSISYEE